MFTLFFVLLGVSAAIWGGWLERVGPRKAGVVAAICWCGGLLISAVGVYIHQLWLMWLGSGIIGGVGLGLGYISPVSTLIKWFPDRRGMATGMAIMGFGGGAMIGSPLATLLMKYFAHADLGRRVGNLRGDGGDLFRLHDVRRLRLQAAADGVETRRRRTSKSPRRRRLARADALEPAAQRAAETPSSTKNRVNIQPRSNWVQSQLVANRARAVMPTLPKRWRRRAGDVPTLAPRRRRGRAAARTR